MTPNVKHIVRESKSRGSRRVPLLFSYGSLRETDVQLATFGRLLHGAGDELSGFDLSRVRIEDPAAVARSGRTDHATVRFTGNEASRVPGMVFDISDAELARVDRYEALFSYRRVAVRTATGRDVWVYLHAADGPGG